MNQSRTDIPGPVDDMPPDALPRPLFGSLGHHPNIVHAQRHRHPWGQLSYAIQGHLQVWTPQARFVALPQCAVWVPARVLHQVQESPHAVIRSLYLDSQALGLEWPHCRVLEVSPLLRELIRAFTRLPSEYDEAGADGRLVQVLVDQLAQARDAGLVLPWPADRRLHTICHLLQDEPESAPTLAAFSKRLGLSEKTLTRLFQQQTGLGFRLWRQRARLAHALPLLEDGRRITDVALACGYDSLSSFIAAFRAHTGTTPGEFAAQAQAEAAPARRARS